MGSGGQEQNNHLMAWIVGTGKMGIIPTIELFFFGGVVADAAVLKIHDFPSTTLVRVLLARLHDTYICF